jgi:hypothetical protein
MGVVQSMPQAVQIAANSLSVLPISGFKDLVPQNLGIIRSLHKSDIIKVAEDAHPVVMAFLIEQAGVGSQDFVRKDEVGREAQFGVELGL